MLFRFIYLGIFFRIGEFGISVFKEWGNRVFFFGGDSCSMIKFLGMVLLDMFLVVCSIF